MGGVTETFNSDRVCELSEKVERKKRTRRADIMEAEEYEAFWKNLVGDGIPRIGVIHLVFHLSNEVCSRICEKVVCCVFIPDSATVKEKILYGSATGILHNDVPEVSKVVTGTKPEDFSFTNVINVCRRD